MVPIALLVEKRRRLMSSGSAAGMMSWFAEMNWMRASSRFRAVSPSLVMMTRIGIKPCWMYCRRKKLHWSGSLQGSAAMVTFSSGWVSKAAY